MERELTDLIKQEGIIKKSFVLWSEKKLKANPATLILTSKRLVLNKNANPFVSVLAQIFIKKARASVVFNVALNEIKDISDVKYGAGVNHMLTISLRDDRAFKIIIEKKKIEAWKAAIAEASK